MRRSNKNHRLLIDDDDERVLKVIFRPLSAGERVNGSSQRLVCELFPLRMFLLFTKALQGNLLPFYRLPKCSRAGV